MRVLVVEDEHKIANAIQQGLKQQSFAVDVAYNGNDGLSLALHEPYDVIILDRMLPGSVDGIGILQQLRATGSHVPVLLLTAKDRVIDRAEGLNAGADDYLGKPFSFVELIARVRALLRRPQQLTQNILEYHDVQLDLGTFQVKRGDEPIELTAKEYTLFEYLMRNPDRIISKDTLIQHVWNYDADILPNTVEVYMGYLRTKIDRAFPERAKLLHTKRGFGYYFGAKA